MILNTREFESALNVVKEALPVKSMVPVLNNILMEVGSCTTLTTNNGAQSITARINQQGDVGAWLLPPKIIEIIKSVSAHEVELIFADSLTIKAGGAKYKLHLDGGVDDFPLKFGDEVTETFDINVSGFADILFSASTEDTRPAFNGVLCDTDKAVTSDTYRLAIKHTGWPESARVLIPAPFLKTATRLGMAKCELGEGWVKFSTNMISMSSRLLGEKYPDISGVLPNEFINEIDIDTAELKATLNRSSLMAEGKQKVVTLTMGEQLTISVDGEQGQFNESLDYSGAECELYFNVKFMLDVLSVAPAKCKLKLTGGDGPIVIEWENFYYLMFPIKKGAQ